jgi:hypothetical protein
MNGHNVRPQNSDSNSLPRIAQNTNFRPEDALRSGASQQHQHTGPHSIELCFQPGPAGTDFPSSRLFVQTPSALGFPFEMFHGIRDISLLSIDSRLRQSAIEQPSGWSYEWPSREVFLITWLLPHKHGPRLGGPLAENRLCRVKMERTGLVTAGRRPELRDIPRIRRRGTLVS